jgi:signal transduction histidine kinase/CheY-like chemotaxis protein
MYRLLTRWQGRLPFRTLALLLVAASSIPLLIFSGLVLRRLVQEQRASHEHALLEFARAQSMIVERELGGSIRALLALAESPTLDDRSLAAFQETATRVVSTQRSWLAVVLLTTAGEQLMNTSRPFGVALGPAVEPASVAEVVRSGGAVVGTVKRGSLGRLAFPVRVPVTRGGALQFVLTAVVSPEALVGAVMGQASPNEEWSRTIIDSAGVVAVRTRGSERFVGQPVRPSVMARVTGVPDVLIRDTALDGEQVYAAFSRGAEYGWRSAVAVPTAAFDSPVRRTIVALAGFSALALTMTGWAAYLVAGRLSHDLREAANAAGMLARGEHPVLGSSGSSEIVQLGASLERSAALLSERERERDEHLARAEDARRGAEDAGRAKDAFMAMLGHELRNPLSPIVSALELLKRRPGVWSREHDVIARQAQHLSRLVNDLLDVSRIARGKVELEYDMVELHTVVQHAIETIRPLIDEQRHHLQVDAPDAGCAVYGDVGRLEQVVANLLNNAARFTPPGGIITVSVRREDGSLVLTVTDTGKGIDAELLPAVFDLFVRGSGTIRRRESGLGLGLTLVRQLVQLHGGTVAAYSAGPDQGSTFTVRLPVPTPQAATRIPPRRLALPPAPSLRILVVDDNYDAADMLAAVLRAQGHQVLTAYDNIAAIDLAQSFLPQLALLDIGLPVMDGYELAAQLHRVLGDRRPGCIAVTGYGQEHDRVRSLREGFLAHFVKPVNIELLAATVRGYARKRSSHT